MLHFRLRLKQLNFIFQWSEKWQIPLNIAKCCVLQCGHNNPNYRKLNVVMKHPDSGRFYGDVGVMRSRRNRAFSSSCSLCIKPVSNSGGRAVHQTGKTFSDEWCLLRIKPAHHLHRPDRPRAPTSDRPGAW
ncbi:hypothetical protein TcasGA2_TC030977 [Tribolium castaneum]|uniref:Uncharacterized protein n=1 Tax=Tribolium castaneum TaxID=7070 RepID=A0A139W8L0_TRICA|nr:hypothetical protein TcasGA2_TC030977 [Tribolium castaneum]